MWKPAAWQHVRKFYSLSAKGSVPSDGVYYQVAVDAAPPVEEVPQRRTWVCTWLSCMMKQDNGHEKMQSVRSCRNELVPESIFKKICLWLCIRQLLPGGLALATVEEWQSGAP